MAHQNGNGGPKHIIARYASKADALNRTFEEPETFVEEIPSERWPDYPYAVLRAAPSQGESELGRWAERLAELRY